MKRTVVSLAVLIWVSVVMVVGAVAGEQASSAGWKIPAGAAEEKNPLPPGDAVITAGKGLFAKRCARCHGTAGKGDGVDADTDNAETMDLTRADGAAKNPDGVVFYKIWNGRAEPRMPAFQDQVTKEQAWAIVAYVQTLRAKK